MANVKMVDCTFTVESPDGSGTTAAHIDSYEAQVYVVNGRISRRRKDVTPIGSNLKRYIYGPPEGQFLLVFPAQTDELSPIPDGSKLSLRLQIAANKHRTIPCYVAGKTEPFLGPGINYESAYQLDIGSDDATAIITDTDS